MRGEESQTNEKTRDANTLQATTQLADTTLTPAEPELAGTVGHDAGGVERLHDESGAVV